MTIRRGDILWADLGMFPTTSVQGGVRPVIVVSNNKANTYSSVITVVPLTSRIYKKRYLPTHVFISKYDMTGIRKGSLALAEQVMSISTPFSQIHLASIKLLTQHASLHTHAQRSTQEFILQSIL